MDGRAAYRAGTAPDAAPAPGLPRRRMGRRHPCRRHRAGRPPPRPRAANDRSEREDRRIPGHDRQPRRDRRRSGTRPEREPGGILKAGRNLHRTDRTGCARTADRSRAGLRGERALGPQDRRPQTRNCGAKTVRLHQGVRLVRTAARSRRREETGGRTTRAKHVVAGGNITLEEARRQRTRPTCAMDRGRSVPAPAQCAAAAPAAAMLENHRDRAGRRSTDPGDGRRAAETRRAHSGSRHQTMALEECIQSGSAGHRAIGQDREASTETSVPRRTPSRTTAAGGRNQVGAPMTEVEREAAQ